VAESDHVTLAFIQHKQPWNSLWCIGF